MQQGYIKLHRSLLEWEWYTDVPVRVLFEHCLLRANHKDNLWRGQVIKKGSFVTSYENLSKETGLTKKQIRTALNKLKRTHEVAHEGHSSHSIITVKNWNRFQSEGTQQGTQRATNKNDKNIIKEKEIYKEKEKKKIHPSLEEIKNYCKERKNSVDPKQFYDYYSVADWKDRDGKPIKNWKQKMIVVWEPKHQKDPPKPITNEKGEIDLNVYNPRL